MKIYNKIKGLAIAAAGLLFVLASCNKVPEDPTAIPQAAPAGTSTIATILNDPNYSIFKAAVTKAGLLPTLSATNLRFTLFLPDDAAMTASGITAAAVAALPVTTITPLVSYHIIPQTVTSASIPTYFPNFQYPTIYNPAPTLSSLLRLTTFPSRRGSNFWVNNIPLTAVDILASNGVIHKVPLVVAPPSQYLWDRISVDPDMTYLKAAIIRADSGVASTSPSSLIGALNNIGANFTVFAPTNLAFQQTLTFQITQALVAQGVPLSFAQAQAAAFASTPNVFSNALLYSSLTATVVKGIIVYHIFDNGEKLPVGSRILRPGRAFTVNFPTTPTAYPTLLNSAVAVHPGVTLQATFGATGVTAATVKGLANATPANILINPTPAPSGTSDQHYLNGVIHKIDQVLIPQ
ncbi:MAG: fasciclin domain-containing protein [Ferruginibacter sp.]